MKFKLDENLGVRGAARLRAAGHDVSTVVDHGLGGATDEKVFAACASGGRILLTLDLDFCQVLRFPPDQCVGVAMLSRPGRMSAGLLHLLPGQFITALPAQPLECGLWIAGPGRIRIHASDSE